MRSFVYTITLVLSILLTGAAIAAQETEVNKQLDQAIKKLSPAVSPDSIRLSAIPGLYEVMFGPKLFYFSKDGRYLINGEIFDIESNKDLTEPRIAQARNNLLDKLGEGKMLIFAPQKVKHAVSVFTDLDCPYCRLMHSKIDQYNAMGIEIRYLLFPRNRVGTPTYNKAVSVWCAKDRKQAFTDAKAGQVIESKTCDNPVKEHMLTGRILGVTGTPTMVTESGAIVNGYVPPKELLRVLSKGSK